MIFQFLMKNKLNCLRVEKKFQFLMKNELNCLRVEKQSVTVQRKQEN